MYIIYNKWVFIILIQLWSRRNSNRKTIVDYKHKSKYMSIFKNIEYLYVYAEMHLSQFRKDK